MCSTNMMAVMERALEAVKRRDIAVLKRACEDDLTIMNHTNQKGMTLMMIAISAGSGEDIVNYLASKRSAPAADLSGKTELMYAAEWRMEAAFKRLLPLYEHDAHDEEGRSATIYAAKSGSLRAMSSLRDQFGHKTLFHGDANHKTPLMYAAEYGNCSCVRYILQTSFESPLTTNHIWNTDKSRRNALMYAVLAGSIATIFALIESPSLETPASAIDHGVETAVLSGRSSVLDVLLACLYKYDDVKRENKPCMLDIAALRGHAVMVELFLQRKKRRNKGQNVVQKYGGEALVIAATLGYLKVVEVLLRHGVRDDHSIALAGACTGKADHPNSMEQSDARVEIVNLLINAALERNQSIIEYVNTPTQGYYPLHYAILSENADLVFLLLTNFADTEVSGVAGASSLDIALAMPTPSKNIIASHILHGAELKPKHAKQLDALDLGWMAAAANVRCSK